MTAAAAVGEGVAGSTVVTFTFQGAKSSATAAHDSRMICSSVALNVVRSPSRLYGGETIVATPYAAFQLVPSVT